MASSIKQFLSSEPSRFPEPVVTSGDCELEEQKMMMLEGNIERLIEMKRPLQKKKQAMQCRCRRLHHAGPRSREIACLEMANRSRFV